MKKRLLAFIIALSLVFAMAVPAFAAGLVCPYCNDNSVRSFQVNKLGVFKQSYHCDACGRSFTEKSIGGWTYYEKGDGPLLPNSTRYYPADKGSAPAASGSTATNNYVYNSVDNSSSTTNTTQNYQVYNTTNKTWYNPVTHNYNTYNNITYNNDYKTYEITSTVVNNETTNNYVTYVTNNYTYLSYNIYNETTGESDYVEVYYELPDGRNSYDLTAADVWGTYFIYDAVNYEEVKEDDGTTLALLHFDGDIQDSSAQNAPVAYESGAQYVFADSEFGKALYWAKGTARKLNITLPENLDGDFTIEGKALFSSASNFSYNAIGSSMGPVSEQVFTGSTWSEAYRAAQQSIESVVGAGGEWESWEIDGSYLFPNSLNAWTWTYSIPVKLYKSCEYIVGGAYLFLNGFFPLLPAVSDSYYVWGYPSIVYDLDTKDFRVYSGYYTDGTCVPLDWAAYNVEPHIFNEPYINGVSSLSTTNEYVTFAVVRKDGVITVYENGLAKEVTVENNTDFGNVISLYVDNTQSVYWDELRVSNKALYTETYTPQSQPFDTNLVLVKPSNPAENQIAVNSNIPVSDLRVGGVRPTYPSDGYVYVYEENGVVQDVQQYQVDGWYSVEASIYAGGSWSELKGYNLAEYELEEVPGSGGDTGGGGDTGDSGDTGGGEDEPSSPGVTDPEGSAGNLGELISGIIGGIISALTAVIGGILDVFTSLVSFTTGFGSFLGEAFAFIPPEIFTIITAGITLMVILAIIKFIRG